MGDSRNKLPKQLKWSEMSTDMLKEEVYSDDDDSDSDEDDQEMTSEEKRSMYNAVKIGDIDRLEDLLDKPNGDIKMIWYNENLVMTAIRFEQEEMAEFLLDNGADQNHSVSLITKPKSVFETSEQYLYSCRQMAYDKQLLNIVEIIDTMNHQLFPGVKPRHRVPRYRREKPPTPSPPLSDQQEQESDSSANDKQLQKVKPVKHKTKKLTKRVSADLLTLLDESEDSDCEAHKARFGKRIVRRGSLPPGVGPRNSTLKSAKSSPSLSAKSTDRDSGVYSLGSERALSQTSSSKPPRISSTSKIKANSHRPEFIITDRDSVDIPISESVIENLEIDVKSHMSTPHRKDVSSNGYKLFGTVARARKPLSAFQYVTDHSRCMTVGYKERPNPRFQDKIRCHGSYGCESIRWSAKKSRKTSTEIRSTDQKQLKSYTSLKETNWNNLKLDVSGLVLNNRPLTKKRIQPNFRKSYSTLWFYG